MVDGRQGSVDIRHRRCRQTRWSIDHQNGDAELPCRLYLGIGRHPAGILGHDVSDTVFGKKGQFVLDCKRPSGRDVARAWHLKRWLHRIYTADEIIMMRRRLKGQKLLSPESQESPRGIRPESRDRTIHIGNALPDVIRVPAPRRSFKRDQRNLCQLRSLDGIGGHARRVRMRRVHQQIETLFADKTCEPTCTTEAASAHRHRLRNRFASSSRHGQQNAIVRTCSQSASQNAGIRCATENKYGACHGI